MDRVLEFFQVIVDQNAKLLDIEKLCFLKGRLTEEVIDAFQAF